VAADYFNGGMLIFGYLPGREFLTVTIITFIGKVGQAY
jgi:hypothetical protein